MTSSLPTRREVLIGSGLAGASALLPFRGALASPDLAALAEEAFIWGVPLVLTGRYLDLAAKAAVPFNQFVLSPDLATPATRAVGPQVDTLYGFAWLDLTAGPQVIAVPDTQDRYYSIQLLDAYADSFAYIGRRTTGTQAGAFAITPPGYRGSLPPEVRAVTAPTSKVLALVRTLVRSKADLPTARAVHASYTLGSLDDYPAKRRAGVLRAESLNVFPYVDLSALGATYFDELNQLLRSYPPLPEDAANLARFALLGVAPGGKVDRALASTLAAAVPAGLARLKQQPGEFWEANGWRTKLGVTNFIRDPLIRAATNLYGPGTHIAQEALYFSARQGPDGQPLTGERRYRLRFPPGQLPPVDAFWSVGLYDRNFFLFDNAIDRYSITDRTPGLRYGPDGSLELRIQADQPTDGPANWLPAPRDAFSLTIRTYQPRPEVLNKTYRLPPLELVA